MPNICDFCMKIRGRKADIITLDYWMRTNYSYSDGSTATLEVTNNNRQTMPSDHHIGYRIFEFSISMPDDVYDNEIVTVNGYGNCAWSVSSCMFEGGYITDHKLEKYALTINQACSMLNIECEIFSNEPGCAFAEHYYIDANGNTIANECVEYREIWLDEYDSYEEMQEAYKENNWDMEITEKEFLGTAEDYIVKCELIDPETEDWSWEFL